MKSISKRFKLGGGFVLLVSLVAISPVGAQVCIQPPPGMTGWWPGDGNTNDIVGGRNALLRDNATTGPGFVNGAFVLDGNGDFVEGPDDQALNVGAGDFTVDFWVYFNTLCTTHPACDQILIEKFIEGGFDPSQPPRGGALPTRQTLLVSMSYGSSGVTFQTLTSASRLPTRGFIMPYGAKLAL